MFDGFGVGGYFGGEGSCEDEFGDVEEVLIFLCFSHF